MLDSIHEVMAVSAAWCVGHAISPTAGLRAFGDESVALDAALNSMALAQLVLVVKKKQYEQVMT